MASTSLLESVLLDGSEHGPEEADVTTVPTRRKSDASVSKLVDIRRVETKRDSRANNSSSHLHDLRSMTILLGVTQALDVGIDSSSSQLEKSSSKERDSVVTDGHRSGRFDQSVEDHGSDSSTRVREKLGDEEAVDEEKESQRRMRRREKKKKRRAHCPQPPFAIREMLSMISRRTGSC